jgi:hypothetical protein
MEPLILGLPKSRTLKTPVSFRWTVPFSGKCGIEINIKDLVKINYKINKIERKLNIRSYIT